MKTILNRRDFALVLLQALREGQVIRQGKVETPIGKIDIANFSIKTRGELNLDDLIAYIERP